MFGVGLQKLILLIAILTAVWYGFRLIGRLAAERKTLQRQERHNRAASRAVEDMVKCRLCGDYVPASGAASCTKADCPSR
ncbi:MAG TPA: hypothetical protein VED46_06080 [Alphaproteobacteria bacterium]|jgi:hypothetical protein|nr:hypothetical protein [Alphaproteobacteria bacterium]